MKEFVVGNIPSLLTPFIKRPPKLLFSPRHAEFEMKRPPGFSKLLISDKV